MNGTFEIPDNVTTIGVFTFMDCSSLALVSIPSYVISIGYCAFSYVNKYSDILIIFYNGTVSQWNEIEFEEDSRETVVHCTDGNIVIDI